MALAAGCRIVCRPKRTKPRLYKFKDVYRQSGYIEGVSEVTVERPNRRTGILLHLAYGIKLDTYATALFEAAKIVKGTGIDTSLTEQAGALLETAKKVNTIVEGANVILKYIPIASNVSAAIGDLTAGINLWLGVLSETQKTASQFTRDRDLEQALQDLSETFAQSAASSDVQANILVTGLCYYQGNIRYEMEV